MSGDRYEKVLGWLTFTGICSSLKNHTELFKITSTKDLFSKIDIWEKEGNWIFRGQRDCQWGLKSSMDQMIEENTNTSFSKVNIEIALVLCQS